MTLADHHVSSFSPWLSIWFRPGDTVARALSSTRTWQILVLAGLGAVAGLIYQVMRDPLFRLGLLDWRVLSGVILCRFHPWHFVALSIRFTVPPGRRMARRPCIPGASPDRAGLGHGAKRDGRGLCATILAGLPASVGRDASRLFSGPVGTALTAILSIAALWTLIVTILTIKRVQGFGFWRAVASYAIGSLLILFVTLLPLMFRSLLFQPFSAQSGSMAPTLLVGDYFFVAKYPYGYSRYSVPLSLPLFSGRILAVEPTLGDVVVFRLPKDNATDYVKRIVGLPGDRVQMIGGVLNINGVPVKRERIADFVDDESGERVRRWRETLPNGVSYDALDVQDNGFLDNTQEYAVPAGHYFVMGDNLDNSTDSRVLGTVGYVPFENLIGRVEMIYFSTKPLSKEQPAVTRSERIGKLVR